MATKYPVATDDNTTLPNPAANNNTNSPSHASQHGNVNDAVKAIENKLGSGASVPAAGTLMIGTGAGTSAWSQLTSAQLAAVLSDETGSGSLVFANTPVLITPKIDTIQESTTNNGVTVGGVNLKAGVITTSSAIPTAALQALSVTYPKLAANLFSGQIASFTNPGSAGGTISWLSLGGIKLMWGTGMTSSSVAWNTINYTAVGFGSVPIITSNSISQGSSNGGWVEFTSLSNPGGASPEIAGCSFLTRIANNSNTNASKINIIGIGL